MQKQDFQEIELSKILPSPWNPRKTFKGPEFDELVDSIREQGVIQPVLVRPIEGKDVPYELVFGERRLKASIVVSKKNGGPENNTIPALIRELDDDQAFELTTIENLQREDLNELEEAQGFKMFADRKGEEALPELAERTGKDIRYIRRRLAVLTLPKKVLKSWQNGELRYGHLQQLLRLGNKKDILEHHREALDGWDGPMSVRELKHHIDGLAPKFELAVFNPEKEGCISCHKNSDIQKKLFGIEELDKAHCLDPGCFKKKQNDFLNGHWKETEYYKVHGTNGFRYIDNLGYSNAEYFYSGRILKICKSCDKFVSLLYDDGRPCREKACIDPKCYKKTYEKSKNKGKAKGSGSNPDDGPRVPWHGEYFREQFYQTRLPEKFKEVRPREVVADRLTLFSLLKSNGELHSWFSKKLDLKKAENDYGHYWLDSKELFASIAEMDIDRIAELLKEASLQVILQGDPDRRRVVGDHIGIDLAKEWIINEEYLQKKTKAEILSIGEKFGIFQDDNARAFLFEVLNKKRGKFKSCKKSELVRVFLESGADLSGKVPDEILN